MSIRFEECPIWGYPARTKANIIGSDVTIAIAKDFNSAGERLTKKLCAENNKIYIPIPAFEKIYSHEMADILFRIPFTVIINVAGNGIYSLTQSQEECNDYCYQILYPIAESKIITLVRTGGQSGFDLAGNRSALALQLDTLVYAPKGWAFRGKDGKDISNEKLFKDRFL